MFKHPNVLSLLRGPLALLFFVHQTEIRCMVVILAVLTDCMDGLIARKHHLVSKIGTILDPAMDKFFALTVCAILLYEKSITGGQMLALFSRDYAILLFAIYLFVKRKWKTYTPRAIFLGKITTFLQFLFFLFFSLHYSIPSYAFSLFIFLGIGSFLELFFTIKISLKKTHEKA